MSTGSTSTILTASIVLLLSGCAQTQPSSACVFPEPPAEVMRPVSEVTFLERLKSLLNPSLGSQQTLTSSGRN